MSTSLLLGVVGAGVGSFFGMPGLGFTIGSSLGNAFFGGNTSGDDLPGVEGPRLNDLRVQGSSYGSPIPIHFGRNRLSGQIIWAPPITEHVTTTEVSGGGSSGGKGGGQPDPPTQTQTTYTYTATFALLVCQGPVSGFGRIWLDGKLFYDARGGTIGGIYAGSSRATSLVFYPGDETQLADPTIEASLGSGNVPAYRGSAYIVFRDLQIDEYGRRIPNVTVEIFRSGTKEDGKEFPVVTGSYFWGDHTSTYINVFTANHSGVLRVLNQQEERIRLLDLQGNFIGYASRDDTLDSYGDQKAHSCGRLNGYNLSFEGDVQFPFDGQHPTMGSGTPPQIYPYPSDADYTIEFEGVRSSDLLGVVEDESEYLAGFAVSADQRRAMIVTCKNNDPFGSACPPSKWYLIYISGENPVVEASGSAAGFPSTLVSGLGIGNRAGLGGVINTFVYSFYAATLENDYKHWWVVYGAGEKPVDCWRVEPAGVTQVYHSVTTQNGAAYPSIIADHGIAWLTNRSNIESFTRLPIHASIEPPLSQIVSELCQLSNLINSDIDVSSLTGNVIGYSIGRQSTIRASLQQLMTAFMFDAVESGGKIKFVPRGTSSVATILQDNLAAHVEGENLPDLITIRRQQELELPKRMSITFINNDADYQAGYQYAARIATDSVDEQSIELAIVMTNDQAAKIADTVLYGMWLARETHQFQVGIEHIALEPCDVITLQIENATYISRITTVEFGAPGLLVLQGAAEDSAVYSSEASAENGGGGLTDQTLLPAGPTELRLLDIPILRAIDNNSGFYMAASGYYEGWKGASVVQSADNAVWNQVKTFLSSSVIGVANSILGGGLTTIPDQANTVNIRINKGELSSITDDQLLLGGNLAALGSEIIQFQDAVLQADGTYILSHFLRGRFGTEWATESHILYEEFTLLNENSLQRILVDENTISTKRYYKAVTLGSTVDASISKTFTFTGVGFKPYAPSHSKGSRDVSNNLTLTWIRRARYGGEWRDNVDVPLGETSENYEVEIINGSAVLRTIAVTSQSASYTAVQQTSDGLTPGNPVHIKIYQLSTTVGRGTPAEAFV
jgi:hypothetical protein